MKKMIAAVLAVLMLTVMLCSCGVEPNSVFSIDDLNGKTIAVQLGTTGDIYASDYEKDEDLADANGNLATIERYKKGADAVLSLKQGKVDCVIIDNEPAKAFIASNPDLKILEEPFAEEEYAIAIKKGNTDLKDKINAALKQLKDNGTLQQIVNNYIGDSTKGTCPYVSPANVDRSNGTLKMATNAEFPPYEYMEGGKIVGIDAEMAQAIADILGMELVIENMDFDAILTAVETGKADIGVAGMTVTEDRLESVDFSDPYATAKQVIIVRVK